MPSIEVCEIFKISANNSCVRYRKG